MFRDLSASLPMNNARVGKNPQPAAQPSLIYNAYAYHLPVDTLHIMTEEYLHISKCYFDALNVFFVASSSRRRGMLISDSGVDG